MTSRHTGDIAERTALEFLQGRGLEHVESNFRSRWGEIDLIMRDTDCLVFVEVRMRKNTRYGGAAASVSIHKQRKLGLTALHYLSCVEQSISLPCRFDVIAIDSQDCVVNWLRDAFQPES